MTPSKELPGSAVVLRDATEADAPYKGARVRSDDGRALLRVNATDFSSAWPGWQASPDAHVLTPVDIERHVSGHWLLFPLCTEPVMSWLNRRAQSQHPIERGEALTLLVSILRGAAHLHECGGHVDHGSWWLNDDGRPVVVAPATVAGAGGDVDGLLDELGRIHPDIVSICRGGVARIAAGDPHVSDVEEALFAAGVPSPLDTAIHKTAPLRVEAAFASGRRGSAPRSSPAPVVAAAHGWVRRHVDERLADRVSDAGTALWRRLQRPKASRKRAPLILAAAAAIVVLGVGLMWPTGSGGATASEPFATDKPEVAATPSGEPTAVPHDLVAVTVDLVSRAVACSDDQCAAAVWEDPDRRTDIAVIDSAPTLVDDFGDVAVLRATATQNVPDQLILIARGDQGWLIRDVYVVADDAS